MKGSDYKTTKKITYFENINGEQVPKKKDVFLYFTHLVSGVIVWYEDHIMMVSSITESDGYDTAGKPYWNDGSGVTILENVYHGTDGINGVGKTRTFGKLIDSDHNKDVSFWRQK